MELETRNAHEYASLVGMQSSHQLINTSHAASRAAAEHDDADGTNISICGGPLVLPSRRVRPKRLRLLDTSTKDTKKDACYEYELDSTVFLSQKKRLRPLPYLTEFACGVKEKVSIPFLEEALGQVCKQQNSGVAVLLDGKKTKLKKSDIGQLMPSGVDEKEQSEEFSFDVMGEVKTNETGAGSFEEKGGTKTVKINPLEDSSLTTLTKSQHERYLNLLHMKHKGTIFSVGTTRNNKQRRRLLDEFRSLEIVVRNERQKYKNALQSFREQNANRFLVGFRRDVIETTLQEKIMNEPLTRIRRWRERWIAAASSRQEDCSGAISKVKDNIAATTSSGDSCWLSAMHYGACSQTIALDAERCLVNDYDIVISASDTKKKGEEDDLQQPRRGMDIDGFHARVLLVISTTKRVVGHYDDLPKVAGLEQKLMTDMVKSIPLLDTYVCKNNGGTRIEDYGQQGSSTATLCLLRNDENAKKIATQHNVNVLLTSEAFAAILNRPGNALSRWKVSVFIEHYSVAGEGGSSSSIKKQLVIFEDPLPHACTPREWMTCGYEGPLDSFLLSSSVGNDASTAGQQEGTATTNSTTHYVYSILTLPTSNNNSSIPVLVRVLNDMMDEDRRPIRRKVKLEYFFSTHGYLEEYTAYERVQWIMEKLLQPRCRVLVGRINPLNGHIVSMEEKNIAFALAGTTSNDFLFDPMSHFRVAGNIAKASTLLRTGTNARSYMICFPACSSDISNNMSSCAASIHPACMMKKNSNVEVLPTISIESELSAAESVFMNRETLLSCFRMFEWDEKRNAGRVPYTFPFATETIIL